MFFSPDSHTKEIWIYCTAELHGMSVEQVKGLLDTCENKYGNMLTPKQKLLYVRRIAERDFPWKCFQFSGEVWNEYGEWLPYVPNWFKHCVSHNPDIRIFENIYGDCNELVVGGKIILATRGKDDVQIGDYVMDFCRKGLYAVPGYIANGVDDNIPKEILLYEYLKYCWKRYIDFC